MPLYLVKHLAAVDVVRDALHFVGGLDAFGNADQSTTRVNAVKG
jgi:hypothetical protein